jgi:D-serine dehydratase
VRGLLRSGCYVTHDHGFYKRMVERGHERLGCERGDGLKPAMEVWATVQSRPEPGLAILAVGKRDISFDLEMPMPLRARHAAALQPQAVPADWKITALNDQHAYLRWRGPEGRRRSRSATGGAGHLASLHHLRQMALDAGGR